MDSTQSGSKVETAESQRSLLVVVYISSLRLIISHLLLQLNHPASQIMVGLNTCDLFLEIQQLLCCFSWVQVTEDRQEANAVLQPPAAHLVATSVLQRLKQVLGPTPVLERAMMASSQILRRYIVHLVALSVAQLVPDHLPANQEGNMTNERMRMAATCTLPAKFTISSELVEDILVKLMLKLHPLNNNGVKQLTQQEMLAMCLQMSAVTLESLRRVPGVVLDTTQPPPVWNTVLSAALLQSSLMKQFGNARQIKKEMAMKNPALLCAIPHGIIEAILNIYQSLSQAYPAGIPISCVTTPREEDEMERRLFSQCLPGYSRERMFQQYGSWIRNTKVFQRAIRKITDENVLKYRRRVIRPRFSNRDVVWVDGSYFVADDYEEVKAPEDNSSVENFLALDCSLAALQKQFPKADVFGDSEPFHKGTAGSSLVKDQGDQPERGCGLDGIIEKDYSFRPLLPSTQPWAGDSIALTAQLPGGSVDTPKISAAKQEIHDEALKWTVWKLLGELFEDQYQHYDHFTIGAELVEHVLLLFQKEAIKYKNNQVFLRTMEQLTDPMYRFQLTQELSMPLKEALNQTLPHLLLSREGLMEDAQTAIFACNIIATELFNHLKPHVTFAEGTKSGDDTPYSVNIPVKREQEETDRPLTMLELRLQKERKESWEEVWKDDAPVMKISKMRKMWSWLQRRFGRKGE